eukprot:5846163-Pleurochrysis_carterae.AAC.1
MPERVFSFTQSRRKRASVWKEGEEQRERRKASERESERERGARVRERASVGERERERWERGRIVVRGAHSLFRIARRRLISAALRDQLASCEHDMRKSGRNASAAMGGERVEL